MVNVLFVIVGMVTLMGGTFALIHGDALLELLGKALKR